MTKDVDPLETTRAEPVRPARLVAGTPIGGYSLLEVLGEGGMGVVWSARDPLLDRTLAIKVLKRTDAAPSLRKRLLREARAMARLKHPNVLTVYEVGTEGERDFIAMELVDGGSLDVWLVGDPPAREVMAALLAAGRGLAAAHAAGLVHRDFKPHNILRSHDGRVMVTDFGLARGLDELTPEPAAAAAKDENLMSAPLTQTGALIGTPAYMAPEQFYGSEPDPRTDQFAFCVTAWQALTGGRPHTGASLDELRIAAAAGVAHLKVDLPGPVRAALARGLDPDPQRRWPSLDALLDELERAARHRRPAWVYAVAGVAALAIAAAIVMVARRPERAAAVAPCAPADRVLAGAWSPALRAELGRAVRVPEPVYARVADALDDYRRRWTETYDRVCGEPAARSFDARIGCLHGLRDRVAVLSSVIRTAGEPVIAALEPPASPVTCAGDSPVAPPALPTDPPLRSRVIAAIGNVLVLRTADPLPEAVARLEAEARAIAWPPLVPLILVAAGHEHLRHHDLARARDALIRAQPLAHDVRDTRLEAEARLGLLEASMRELENPGQRAKKPDQLHDELSRLIEYARSAVRAAGDDPVLAGSLELLEARATAQLGRWSLQKKPFREALALVASARRRFEAAGDLRRAALAAAAEATIDLHRGDERALDDALFAARSADEALERARLPGVPEVDEIRAQVAFLRGDFDEAHRRFDRIARAAAPVAAAAVLTGRVVDDRGAPREGATIVAWTGELHGDPQRIYSDARTVHGEIVESAADGSFTIHAAPGAAIVASHGERRSVPQLAGQDPITLRLGPTSAITGTLEVERARIDGDAIGASAFASYAAGDAAWIVRSPIKKDRTFSLGGLPRAPSTLGAIGPAGDGTRRVTAAPGKLRWPQGQAIEVIVRGKALGDTAAAWLFRGRVAPHTRAELDALAARAGELATAPLGPIGFDATDEGREHYEAGDRHAVIAGNSDGEVTVCAAAGSAVACERLEVKRSRRVGDRAGSDVMPVLIQLP